METEVTLGHIDIDTVKTRSISGVITLITRSFIQRIISSVGFFFISVFLSRPEIGIFIAVNDLVSILGYFSDIGLAASLIQKKDQITREDLKTTFTLQQLIVSSLIILTIAGSYWILKFYQIGTGGSWLFFSLLLAFFLASLKTIPSVILERQLKFEVLALVEMVETVVFYVIVVVLAWKGFGISSYAIAVLVRGVIGTTILYKLSPWKMGLGISKSSLKSLLSFGLPYQFNSLMAVIKDRFVNIALWKIVGADGVGILGWAQNWSQLPLRFVMDNVTKVTFPAYARLQSHPDQLKNAIEKTLFFIAFLTFPLVAGLAIISPMLIHIIPKYAKWEVALIPLILYCFNSAWASISTPLTNLINAMGKVKINSYLMIMWTLLTWILTPWLAIKYGYIGVSYASAIIALSSIVPIIIAKNLVNFSLKKSVLPPVIAVIIMFMLGWYLVHALPASIANVIVIIVACSIVYFSLNIVFLGQNLIVDVKKFSHAFIHRKK